MGIEIFHSQNYFTRRIHPKFFLNLLDIFGMISTSGLPRVYALSHNYVAKIPTLDDLVKYKPSVEELLSHEYEVCNDLYNNEISVPKPEGIYHIRIRWFDNLRNGYHSDIEMAFVMQRIHGSMLEKVGGDLRQKGIEFIDKESARCEALGYTIPGDIFNNCIYDKHLGHFFFIDFEGWYKKKDLSV